MLASFASCLAIFGAIVLWTMVGNTLKQLRPRERLLPIILVGLLVLSLFLYDVGEEQRSLGWLALGIIGGLVLPKHSAFLFRTLTFAGVAWVVINCLLVVLEPSRNRRS